ncbi:MAG: phage tail protein [Actinobacteria bacterium]|nr:phage tail protein [Actinomycetota bacterium]
MSDLMMPEPSHRFLATFFFQRLPSPLDIRFSHISGLNAEVSGEVLREGGRNVGGILLPDQVTFGTLSLERGIVAATPITLWFDRMMSELRGHYADVVIMLLNEGGLPVCSWTVSQALPSRWSTGDLDASGNTVLINHLELTYHDMLWMGAKR